MARLSELKVEMGDRVQQLERAKSDQTDVIGRFAQFFKLYNMIIIYGFWVCYYLLISLKCSPPHI